MAEVLAFRSEVIALSGQLPDTAPSSRTHLAAVPADVPATRWPGPAELALIRDVLDPGGQRDGELP